MLFATRLNFLNCILLGGLEIQDNNVSWWIQFLLDANVGESKEDREAIATRFNQADLDESLLGELTKECLAGVDLKLSVGQQMKIMRYIPIFLMLKRLREKGGDKVTEIYIGLYYI